MIKEVKDACRKECEALKNPSHKFAIFISYYIGRTESF